MEVTRTHEIDAGHRVFNHGGKCRNIHGHRYEIAFTCQANDLNDLGMVIDFGDMKSRLCQWLEDNWDHKTLLWQKDDLLEPMQKIWGDAIVALPINPTAENLCKYLLQEVGPAQLQGTGITLTKVKINETRKCSAEYVSG